MVLDAPVLVVDDDPKILQLICLYLEREGYRTMAVSDGLEGLELALKHRPQLVVLDLLLPRLSGFDLCRRLREVLDTPLLIVSAKGEEEDKLAGLALGADDYMSKPFSPRELVARVKAILRRAGARTERVPRLTLHGVQLHYDRHLVRVDGREVRLTAFEFKLLSTLMEFPGKVFTREALLGQIYAFDELYVVDRTIDVHIGKLRHKIERDPSNPERLLTVRGVGYKFRGVGEEEWVG
jgi:DNA-binding response OmpR family regulator